MILYLDCLIVKSRESGTVADRAIYMAIDVNIEGQKEVLGLWSAATEGAKFWLSVVTELKNHGVRDVLTACVDGLKGFPEAIEAVFPKTVVQLAAAIGCVVTAFLSIYLAWLLLFAGFSISALPSPLARRIFSQKRDFAS